MYKVIKFFTDLQDYGHAYNVGDTFPRVGMSVSEERLKELSTSTNLQGVALIQKVDDVKEVTKSTYSKTDINRMSKDTLVELAKSLGIETEEKSGAELKADLIKHYNL